MKNNSFRIPVVETACLLRFLVQLSTVFVLQFQVKVSFELHQLMTNREDCYILLSVVPKMRS